eukprot:COSAG01_NODE_1524_length_10019_cov_6.258367_2_plen_70_part_00
MQASSHELWCAATAVLLLLCCQAGKTVSMNEIIEWDGVPLMSSDGQTLHLTCDLQLFDPTASFVGIEGQ